MRILKKIFLSSLIILGFASCKESTDNKIVIWTNCSEFAQYTEIYNKTHKNNKAIIVYKDNPAAALPPSKDELDPDIIVGPWLRTNDVSKNFKLLNYLFDRKNISSDIFYEELLTAGKLHNKQYLIPFSFNLPVVLFSKENEKLLTNDYTLSLDDIKTISASFNKKKNNGAYTAIGFAPASNKDFLYLVTKCYGVDFRQDNNKFYHNETKLDNAVTFIRDWVETENTSVTTEEEFVYKYLSMPDYRQVTSGKTLFAYATSDRLFDVMRNQDLAIDYRWIVDNNSLILEDSMLFTGIYKKAKNKAGASEFLSWLFDIQSQKDIMDRKIKLNLNTETFGLAGGFSSLKEITEHVLPVYYTQLLTNLPPSQYFKAPQKLSSKWESYKAAVVEPYIRNLITIQEGEEKLSIVDLEKDWRKKLFD